MVTFFFDFDKTVLFTLNYPRQFWEPLCRSPLWFWIAKDIFLITFWLSQDLEPSNGVEIFPDNSRININIINIINIRDYNT